MEKNSRLELLLLILRVGLAGTFLGHGLTAYALPEAWLGYLQCVGLESQNGIATLKVIGTMDVIVAVWLFIKPNRPLVIWGFIWLVAVSLIRPLCGESWLELVKRSGYMACAAAWLLVNAEGRHFRKAGPPDA
jgi:hypothetical protein